MRYLEFAGFYKTANFHRDDKIVVNFDNIEAVLTTKGIV